MGWKDKIKIAVFGYRATSISYIEHLKKNWSKSRQ